MVYPGVFRMFFLSHRYSSDRFSSSSCRVVQLQTNPARTSKFPDFCEQGRVHFTNDLNFANSWSLTKTLLSCKIILLVFLSFRFPEVDLDFAHGRDSRKNMTGVGLPRLRWSLFRVWSTTLLFQHSWALNWLLSRIWALNWLLSKI